MALTIEQVNIALDTIKNQINDDGCNIDALDLQLKTIRRWSNKAHMELSGIGNKLLKLENELSLKVKEENNTT